MSPVPVPPVVATPRAVEYPVPGALTVKPVTAPTGTLSAVIPTISPEPVPLVVASPEALEYPAPYQQPPRGPTYRCSRSKTYSQLRRLRQVLPRCHTCEAQQPARGYERRRVAVLVAHEDDLNDAALDDELGALVAREQRHVELQQREARTVSVQHRVLRG